MSANKTSHPNLTLAKGALLSQMSRSIRITLIDAENQRLEPVAQALKSEGYSLRYCRNTGEAIRYLSETDLLLIDTAVAKDSRTGRLINVPTILVLTDDDADELPPWLEARHIFLVQYPQAPAEVVNLLPEYLTPPIPDIGGTPANPKHLALLFGITQTLSGHFLDVNDLFERILALAPHLNADFSALLVQEGDETIYYRSTQPGREELTGPAGRRFAERIINDGLEGWVLRHNQVAVLTNTMLDSRWFRASYLPDEAHCAVALPFTLERIEARGAYIIGQKRPAQFSEEDLSLLKAVTTQVGMAIENAILFKNQSERSVQLSLINEVGQAATSILNLDAMLRTVVQAIRRRFTFYNVSIHLYNSDTQLVELRARIGSDPESVKPPSPSNLISHKLRQGLIGWAMATGKTILANDVTRDARYIFENSNKEVRAELCIPIALGTKTIGVLDLRSTQLEAFDKYQVSALETLADQLAIAIENARLYDETKQHVKELGSLNEIGQAITSTLDLQEILKLITYQTTSLMNVAAASVALRDDKTDEVWFAAASGEGSEVMPGLRMPLGQGLAGWVAEKGEAVIVPDVNADSRFFAAVDKSSGFITKSILCVPLQTKGHTIGAIEVMNKMNGEFNREDLSLLQALATSAATAIENARLFQQAETLHAFNRDIIRTMTNGLIAVDKSGHITAFNPAATVMLGTEIHKILQQPMQEVLTGNEELIEIFRQTLTTGQTQAHREITVQHWDGNSLPIAVNVAPLTAGDDSRQLMGAVGVLEDLSEVKALEAERRRLDRLAALGEMSAVIAHEIRNPVAGIAAGVEYLTRKIRPGSPDFEGAGMIQSEIKRVNRILEDILFVARPLQLNISEEHIPTIIEDVLQRCQPQIAASQLTTSASHAVNVPLLIVDRQRLEQVFTNLIINATQAMQSGGNLTLHTEVLNAENGLCSAELAITISDTGPGIPVEVRRRVFEPFFTTKTRGTGLGLAVARRIIEEHKGTIKIESEAGQGTRFIIRLPVNKEAAR